jgi:hypothetical protein
VSGNYPSECGYEFTHNGETILEKATNSAAPDAGVFFTYTVDCTPDPCTTPQDLAADEIGASTANLSWIGNNEVYNLQYRYRESPDKAVPIGDWILVDNVTTPYSLNGLNPETYYEWQVQGISSDCEGGVTEWSEIATFTTLDACTVPSELMSSDVTHNQATLSWTGFQESYNVQYRTAARAGEWNIVTVNTTTLDLTGLVPETIYEWKVQGVDCDGEGNDTEWSEIAAFTTGEQTTVTQTIELVAGYNWISFNVEITLDNLKAALVEALPGATSIKINSQSNGTATYNGARWRGQLNAIDLTQMYMVEVPTDCEMMLEGFPIDPANYPVTIKPGQNWIAFPLSQSMTLTDVFAGFAINGDKVTSQTNGSATYTGRWRGQLPTLEAGKGYMYESAADSDRTFTFPENAK